MFAHNKAGVCTRADKTAAYALGTPGPCAAPPVRAHPTAKTPQNASAAVAGSLEGKNSCVNTVLSWAYTMKSYLAWSRVARNNVAAPRAQSACIATDALPPTRALTVRQPAGALPRAPRVCSPF